MSNTKILIANPAIKTAFYSKSVFDIGNNVCGVAKKNGYYYQRKLDFYFEFGK